VTIIKKKKCIIIFLLIEGLEIEHVHLYLLGEQGLVLYGFDGAMNRYKDIIKK
jgi:hypothetical protein